VPTYGKGFLTVGAYKNSAAGTWGTPIQCGALNGLEFINEAIVTDSQFVQDAQVSGFAARLSGDKGNELHNGPVNLDMRYEGLQTLFASCFGTAGTPAQVGTNNLYKHVLQMNSSLEGIFGTLIFNKQVAIWEYTTAKLQGFKISCAQGQRAKVEFRFICQGLNFNTGSGTNNTTTITSVTLPANRDFALFSQMKVLVNDQASGALTSGTDDIYVSSFELNYQLPMPNNDVTTQFGNKVDEPVQDGFTTPVGVIMLSKYQTLAPQTLLTQMLSKARKKMMVQWTGPVVGTSNYQFTLYFPDIQFSRGAAAVPGAGRIPLRLEYEAHRALTLPTGFPTGYTSPVTMEDQNQVNSNSLA